MVYLISTPWNYNTSGWQLSFSSYTTFANTTLVKRGTFTLLSSSMISLSISISWWLLVATGHNPATESVHHTSCNIVIGPDTDKETVQLLDIPASVPDGELVSFEDKELGEPNTMLKSKGALKVWDRVETKLRVNADEEATINMQMMVSAGHAKVSFLTPCIIGW